MEIVVAQIYKFTECAFVLLEVEVNGEQVRGSGKQTSFTLIPFAWSLFLN
jgi:hypothetical protein